MMTTKKKCPMCAEEIPLTAVTCEYCGAQFEVTDTGYCQNCHQVREADGNGQCKVCGNKVMDLRVESRLIEEPVQEPLPASQPIAQTEITKSRRSRLPVGILAGILILAVIGTFLWFGRNSIPAISSLIATSTPTATTTFTPTSTPTATATPTRTPSPTPTVTPIPTWVTEFAEPILAAITNKRPNFQDDFSQASVSWRFENDNRGKMEIKDGALIMTSGQGGTGYAGYSAAHPAMRFKNFALRVDIDLSKLGSRDDAGIVWRGTDYSHGLIGFTISNNGRWWVGYHNPWFKLASGGKSINSTHKVTVTIISKGTEYAIYIDETPVSYINDSGRRPGIAIKLYVYDDDLGSPTVVTFDNLKVWDLDKIQVQP